MRRFLIFNKRCLLQWSIEVGIRFYASDGKEVNGKKADLALYQIQYLKIGRPDDLRCCSSPRANSPWGQN
jgi:hypothetical protein